MKAEIYVPSNLRDITLEQYSYLMSIQKDEDNEQFAARKMIAVFCKIPLSDVLKISYSSILELTQKFNAIFQEDKPFINRFTLGNTEFGFIPDLENISFGEYIDAEKYLSDWSTMHNAMAVLYRPIVKKKGEKYTIEKYETSATYAEVMKAAPLDVVLGMQLFFWTLRKELLIATMDYLAVQITEMGEEISQHQLHSVTGGVGINQYINSLKEMLDDSMQLPNYRSINV
jgi:hypothetical protein